MDHKSIELSCRFCKRKKPFTMQSIVQHAIKSTCPYNEKMISALRDESKEISEAKHKIKMALRYQRKKQEISKNYQNVKKGNPDVYEKKRQETCLGEKSLKSLSATLILPESQ